MRGFFQGIADKLTVMAHGVDMWARRQDLRFNRTDDKAWAHKWSPRHSPFVLIIGLWTLVVITTGPIVRSRNWWWLLVVVPAAGLLWLALKCLGADVKTVRPGLRKLGVASLVVWLVLLLWALLEMFDLVPFSYPIVKWLVVAATGLGVLGTLGVARGLLCAVAWVLFVGAGWLIWERADANALEDQNVVYRHMFLFVSAMALFFGLPFSRWFASYVLGNRKVLKGFRAQLPNTQLFGKPPPQKPKRLGTTFWDVLRALFIAPVTTPLEIAGPPALMIVAARDDVMPKLAIPVLVLSWLFLAMTVFHPRLQYTLATIRRLFLEGASGVISLLIILFAALRLAGVNYITTVLDGAAWWAIMQYFLALYALSWTYDYWSRRAMCDAMLQLLTADGEPTDRVKYRKADKDEADEVDIILAVDDHKRTCYIQPHGGARFAVVREPVEIGSEEATKRKALAPQEQKFLRDRDGVHWQVYPPLELFQELAMSASRRSGLRETYARLVTRTRFVRALPAVVFLVLLYWFADKQWENTRAPHIEAQAAEASAFAFAKRVKEIRADNPDKPDVLLIASSGGGTRAAVYTHELLRSLHGQDALRRVAMVSSVSGGSLATGFLAAHHKALLEQEVDGAIWQRFKGAVEGRHIERVLRGVFEWRLAEKDRLGILLAESFEHYLGGKPSLGTVGNIGIFLNTGVVGDAKTKCTKTDKTSGTLAGSRLVFTNVAGFRADAITGHTGAGAPRGSTGYAPDLRYTIFGQGKIEIPRAVSASANFPPIFSNVAIDDTGSGRRYWVTDGGSVDNRGLMTLLLATTQLVRNWTKADGDLPPLRILVVDVSGYSAGFSQDRGIGSATGSKGKGFSKLMRALFEGLRRTYLDKLVALRDAKTIKERTRLREEVDERVTIHDVTMPKAFRASFGTHWTLPAKVTLQRKKWNPVKAKLDDPPVLSKQTLLQTVRQLLNVVDRQWPAHGAQIDKWIKDDDPLPRPQEGPGHAVAFTACRRRGRIGRRPGT